MQNTFSEAPPARLPFAPWVAAALVVTLALAGYSFVYIPTAADEDQWIEWAQAVLLLLAAGSHALCSRRGATPLDILLHIGLGLLAATGALRELDIDRFGPQPGWAALELALRGVALSLWALLFWNAVRWHRTRGLGRASPALRTAVLLTGCGLLCFLAGWPFDQKLVPGLTEHRSQWVEEIFELCGSLLLAAGGVRGFLRR